MPKNSAFDIAVSWLRFPTLSLFAFFALLFATQVIAQTEDNARQKFDPTDAPQAYGGEVKLPENVCLTDEQRAEIQRNLQLNIESLIGSGKIQERLVTAAPQFIFPIRAAGNSLTDFGVYGISNFVDHNFAFPNSLRDYNCGARTYDTSGGYNHQGIDISTFPFPWNKMDNSEAIIVAAADGVIINKSDGNADRSCFFNSSNWNAVYLRHSDGTISWYGHMKRNSLTAKTVGQTVSQGEYLGVVGSSGNSTGPHLHFELYNSANQLQDPFQGTCNLMNATSYWLNQPAYYDSKINKLMTHSAPPAFGTCPNPEVTNEKRNFQPGEQIYTAIYYRDQVTGQTSQYSLIQPNGAVYTSWSQNSPGTYSQSYWYWIWNLPGNAQSGVWTLRAVYQNQTYEQKFSVGPGFSVAGTVTYGTSPANQTQKFVSGALMSVSGITANPLNTGATGTYLVANLLAAGQYTVTPTKTGSANGISSFDATLVLRHVAAGGQGANALNANQILAADTDGSNSVSAFDATQILRYVAANGSNANTGQVANWKFSPVSRPYSSLSNSLTGENYTAVLIGEINGDWTP
jgi:murein DD-endopeptidase MepM/ murein hydrolase activator NlpD